MAGDSGAYLASSGPEGDTGDSGHRPAPRRWFSQAPATQDIACVLTDGSEHLLAVAVDPPSTDEELREQLAQLSGIPGDMLRVYDAPHGEVHRRELHLFPSARRALLGAERVWVEYDATPRDDPGALTGSDAGGGYGYPYHPTDGDEGAPDGAQQYNGYAAAADQYGADQYGAPAQYSGGSNNGPGQYSGGPGQYSGDSAQYGAAGAAGDGGGAYAAEASGGAAPRPVLSSHKLFFPGQPGPERMLCSVIHIHNPTDRPWLYRVRLNRELMGGWSARRKAELPRYLAVRPAHGSGRLEPGQGAEVPVDVVSDACHELRQQQEELALSDPAHSARGSKNPFKVRVDLTDLSECDPHTGQPLTQPVQEAISVRFADPPTDAAFDIAYPDGEGGLERVCTLPEGWWEARAQQQHTDAGGGWSAELSAGPGAAAGGADLASSAQQRWGAPHAAAPQPQEPDVLRQLMQVAQELEHEQHRHEELYRLYAQLEDQLRQRREERDRALQALQELWEPEIQHEHRLSEQRAREQGAARQQNRKIQELQKRIEEADRLITLLRGDIETEEKEKENLRLRNQMVAQDKERQERMLVDRLVEIEAGVDAYDTARDEHEQRGQQDGCIVA